MRRMVLALGLPFGGNVAQAGWLWGVDGDSADCPVSHSLAWCVMDYAGVSEGLKDVEVPAEQSDSMRVADAYDAPDRNVRASRIAIELGRLTRYGSGVPGVSAQAGVAITLLAAAFDNGPAAKRNQVLVMMPVAEVPSDTDPSDVLLEIYGRAGITALGAESFEIEKKENYPKLGPHSTDRTLIFKGGACQEKRCELVSSMFRVGDGNRYDEVTAPAYMGGGRVYRWFNAYGWYEPRFGVDGKGLSFQARLKFAESLPDWNYQYFAPSEAQFPFPFVARQGGLLIFVRSAKDS